MFRLLLAASLICSSTPAFTQPIATSFTYPSSHPSGLAPRPANDDRRGGRRDDASQLLTLNSTLLGNPVESFAYGYDPVGNRTSLTDRFGAHTFGYDVLSRLTSALHPVVAPFVTEAFSYDPVGNRTSSHLSTSYNYESANRLLSDDTFTYAYDANGNLTSKTTKTLPAQTTTYAYNVENQLTRVTLPDGREVTYRYDGLGRRIERSVTAGATERFVYDQKDLIEVYNTAGCWQETIFHGPGIDQPYAFITDTDGSCSPSWGIFAEPARYLTTDGLGSITALSAAVGGSSFAINLAERYIYDSFGNLTITDASGTPRTSSAFGERYFFTGREYDFDTRLYHFRTRDYDPSTGRFITADRLLFGNVNKYEYARNNPLTFFDPFGFEAKEARLAQYRSVHQATLYTEDNGQRTVVGFFPAEGGAVQSFTHYVPGKVEINQYVSRIGPLVLESTNKEQRWYLVKEERVISDAEAREKLALAHSLAEDPPSYTWNPVTQGGDPLHQGPAQCITFGEALRGYSPIPHNKE